MRKEYSICSYQIDVYDAIKDFFSNAQVSSLYTLIDDQWDRVVYHNNVENLDLIFYTSQDMLYQDEYRLCLLVTTEYNANIDPFFLSDVICNGVNHHEAMNINNLVYYFPAPTLLCRSFTDSPSGDCPMDKLVINFNSENSTFMITLVRNYLLDYDYTKAVAHRTSSICFGMVDKTLDFDGGFFYGGDFMCTYEKVYREATPSGQVAGQFTYCVYDSSFNDIAFHNPMGWANHPYSLYSYLNSSGSARKISNPNNVNRFDAILRANIDYAPMRKHDDEVIPPERDPSNPAKPYFINPPPKIVRNQTWAVTMNLDYYVPMVCSITNVDTELPRYTPLLSDDYLHKGRAINTNNKMSVVMPLWFMVRRDPEELEDYSYAGKNKVINYVNMRYMDTNRIIDSSFPTQEEVNKYNCFQMGSRRAFFGMKGYSGLAFRMEEGEDSVAPNLGLLDFDEMEKHVTGGEPILNIDFGGELGYGGDTGFDNMPEGSFILKKPYTDYSSIIFKFGNDAGTVTDTVIWASSQLTSALNGTDPFNLLPANSPVTWGGRPGQWMILPFADGSTPTVFLCDDQNCSLIGIKGNP